MTFIWLITAIISLFYTILIAFFTTGWVKRKKKYNQQSLSGTFVSVIVVARNEERNISVLLKALSEQLYRNFEIIIIDDHSTDKTYQIIEDFKLSNCKLIKLNKNLKGKKVSLTNAMSLAKGELIATTDADCIPGKNWLQSLVTCFEIEHAVFIIGPVKQITSNNFFQQLFSLDFLSLQATGAGAANMNKPFICNGANLAFAKLVWEKISGSIYNKYASGDDVFLLHEVTKILPAKNIRFLFSDDSIVLTKPPANVPAFFNQRIRWASKAKGYKNEISVITSFIVLFMNILLFGLLTASFFSIQFFYCFLFVLILKSVIDFPVLYLSAVFYKQQKLLWYYVPLQLVYYIYTSVIVIFSLFGKYKWKERNCR